jgi:SOS-response transcriptional repressor LexA
MNGITPRQSEALAFIRTFIDDKGWSPSFEEIGAAIGLRSKGSVHRLVAGLAERGAITFSTYHRRSIEIAVRPRPPEGIDFLPHELAVWVRVLAARAGVKPLDVITECVRDAYVAQKKLEPVPQKAVSHETPSAGPVAA